MHGEEKPGVTVERQGVIDIPPRPGADNYVASSLLPNDIRIMRESVVYLSAVVKCRYRYDTM